MPCLACGLPPASSWSTHIERGLAICEKKRVDYFLLICKGESQTCSYLSSYKWKYSRERIFEYDVHSMDDVFSIGGFFDPLGHNKLHGGLNFSENVMCQEENREVFGLPCLAYAI